MSVRRPRGSAFFHRLLLAVSVGVPAVSSVLAQSTSLPSDVSGNAYRRVVAEGERRNVQHWSVYTPDGQLVGRLRAIRLSPEGVGEVAIVNVRSKMGGGQIGLPLHHLKRRQGRIVAEDGGAILQMRRLGTAAERSR